MVHIMLSIAYLISSTHAQSVKRDGRNFTKAKKKKKTRITDAAVLAVGSSKKAIIATTQMKGILGDWKQNL